MSDEPLAREREPIERVRARLEALVMANAAPRCGARSKRTGKPCREAAMPDGRCKVLFTSERGGPMSAKTPSWRRIGSRISGDRTVQLRLRRRLDPMLTVRKTENTLMAPINAEYRVMTPVTLVSEEDLHFVLCDFGRPGQAYVETDPTEADASTIVRNLLGGQYDRPVRVLALNVEEGWVRDVSGVIAVKVQDVARREGQGLTVGTRAFIEAHSDPSDEQQMLPLWQ
jgi:hypothetical protein